VSGNTTGCSCRSNVISSCSFFILVALLSYWTAI
jgi:hypothetical protein